MFKVIDDLKKKLDLHRPFSPITIKNLSEDIILRWTYHSNAIEGNKLTLLETKVVLEGIAVGGKTLKDHFEAINHRNAIYYVEDIIRKEEPFSEWQICNIHQLILKNIDAYKLHPIERAAKVHADFVGIHPFIDGNGRTSRLLMNLELLKAGYPPCVITVENRLAYYEALDQWMAYGKIEAFIQLVSDAVLEGFKPYQVVLGI